MLRTPRSVHDDTLGELCWVNYSEDPGNLISVTAAGHHHRFFVVLFP